MSNCAHFIISDEEIQDKLKALNRSSTKYVLNILDFALSVLLNGGKVAVRQQGKTDIPITSQSDLSAYKTSLKLDLIKSTLAIIEVGNSDYKEYVDHNQTNEAQSP